MKRAISIVLGAGGAIALVRALARPVRGSGHVRAPVTVRPIAPPEPVSVLPATAPASQPEPTAGHLAAGRSGSAVVAAVRGALAHDVPMLAAALAYAAFFAIPSMLLLATGLFSMIADETAIVDTTRRLKHVVPPEVADLLTGSLTQLASKPQSGLLLTVVGLVLALWSSVGAAGTYITAARRAYDAGPREGFVRQRLHGLAVIGCVGAAMLAIVVLVVLGPILQAAVGTATGHPTAVGWLWWAGQWPLLIGILLLAFTTVLWLGPSHATRSWASHLKAAAVVAVGWLVVSGAFAAYTAGFGSYNKTWGVLSAAVVTLTWLWLTGIALLVGAELDAELERRGASPQIGNPQ